MAAVAPCDHGQLFKKKKKEHGLSNKLYTDTVKIKRWV